MFRHKFKGIQIRINAEPFAVKANKSFMRLLENIDENLNMKSFCYKKIFRSRYFNFYLKISFLGFLILPPEFLPLKMSHYFFFWEWDLIFKLKVFLIQAGRYFRIFNYISVKRCNFSKIIIFFPKVIFISVPCKSSFHLFLNT